MRNYRLLPALFSVLILLPSLVSAQGFGDEDNLYIPPKLTVENRMSSGAPKIELYERYSPTWLPLLPALFFDNPGDWTIPERYVQFAAPSKTFEYTDTNNVADPRNSRLKYYELLNILGYRLRTYPDAVLSLRGGYSAEGGETEEVARERSLVVREYLQQVWGIDTARLPLLPVARRADTLENNALQEEARRVEFTTDHPELLAPVSFNLVGISAMPMMLRAVVLPNMPPEQVDSIVFVMLDQSGQVHDRRAFPGNPDSARYEVQVMWEQTMEMKDDGMVLQMMVRARGGTYRPSNSLSLPINVIHPDPDDELPMLDFWTARIPVLSPGDSLLGIHEKRAMRDAVALFRSRITPEDSLGYFLLARGSVGMEEDPGRNGVEVNVLYDSQRAAFETRDPDNEWAGRLWVMVAIPNEDGYGTTFVEYGSEEKHEEREKMQEERMQERKREHDEHPGFRIADTIANGRARMAMRYLRDSLELPLINSELPANFTQASLSYGSGFQLSHQFGEARPQEGIIESVGGSVLHFPLVPEERWYRRGVELRFFTRENIGNMMNMFER